MDFLRLAVREARRNATRTLVAVFAVALAAAAPVLTRMIPTGYVTEYASIQRVFSGGDVLIWTAPAPLDLRESSGLVWRSWEGRDWQSDALYFLPDLETRGYLAEDSAPLWSGMSAAAVAARLEGIKGVSEVRPYLSLPCLVETESGPFPAILRGRDPETAGDPVAMARLVVAGRDLSLADGGEYVALVPLQGTPAWQSSFIEQEVALSVPRLVIPASSAPGGGGQAAKSYGSTGLSWDGPVGVTLRAVGGYQVQTGTMTDFSQPRDDVHNTYLVVPVFWERPEIVVTEETFRQIASLAMGRPAPNLSDFPVYQLSLTVARMLSLKSTVSAIRQALGGGFAVYSVPELLDMKDAAVTTPVVSRDLWPVFTGLTFGLSAVIVVGSVYILLAQQRRKIGLLRVVGATRRDIVTYALGVTLYVTVTGLAAGFLTGKVLSLTMLLASDITPHEWLVQAGREFLTVFGVSLGATAVLGSAVGFWASRIPCAEVLRRE
jgi:hypothetical protein